MEISNNADVDMDTFLYLCVVIYCLGVNKNVQVVKLRAFDVRPHGELGAEDARR